ncbi:hypothetical protein [Ruegeria atlantica]|nr:hypothetical protein [Ruegeria atlantica]
MRYIAFGIWRGNSPVVLTGHRIGGRKSLYCPIGLTFTEDSAAAD